MVYARTHKYARMFVCKEPRARKEALPTTYSTVCKLLRKVEVPTTTFVTEYNV